MSIAAITARQHAASRDWWSIVPAGLIGGLICGGFLVGSFLGPAAGIAGSALGAIAGFLVDRARSKPATA